MTIPLSEIEYINKRLSQFATQNGISFNGSHDLTTIEEWHRQALTSKRTRTGGRKRKVSLVSI